ncbi:MAG TPA: hypothetical protein VFU15_12450 [Bacteroidia bacterium]|nr:hypothetical protein [Bacteroidia bacterium]
MSSSRLFVRKASRHKHGVNPLLFLIILAWLVIAFVVYVNNEGATSVYLPGPLLIYFLYRSGRNRTEEVTVVIEKDNKDGDLYFYYLNEDKEKKDDYPIDEFSYWYVRNLSGNKTKSFDLFVKFQCEGKDPVFLKETKVNFDVTPGWEELDEKPGSSAQTFLVPDIGQLASILDSAATTENDESPAVNLPQQS